MCIPRLLQADLRDSDRDRDAPEAEVTSAVIHSVPAEPAAAEEVRCNG